MKRRILSIITALALCLSLCPTWAFAAEGEPGLCAHHPSHTEDCGCIAPTEGQPCGHEHTDECYITDVDGGEVLGCQHAHDGACGYVQAAPGAPCGYECRICPIENLIVALPEEVAEDNRADVEARLNEILDLYRELEPEEREQLNLSRVTALQGQLDAAAIPALMAETAGTGTAEDPWQCGDGVTATLAGDTLTISHTGTGTGAMANYGVREQPWGGKLAEITTVVIESGVTRIGDSAFDQCTSLTNVTIPNTVTDIGGSAFFNCNQLQSITIPDSVNTIGGSAFSYCTSLESITIPEGVTCINASLCSYCKSLTSVTLPSTVTEIKAKVFNNCANLKTVTFKGATAPKLEYSALDNRYPFDILSDSATIKTPHGASGYTDKGWPADKIEKHVWRDRVCTCGLQGVAEVQPSSGDLEIYTTLQDAWEAACTAETATVTLLANAPLDAPLTLDNSSAHITLNGGGYTITADGDGVQVYDGALSIAGCTITAGGNGVYVNGGTVDITNCTITGTGQAGVFAGQDSSVNIAGGVICGGNNGLLAMSERVKISGGSFSGSAYAIFCNSDATLLGILDSTDGNRRAYYGSFEGEEIPCMLQEENQTVLSGGNITFTVRVCGHEESAVGTFPNRNGTHTTRCAACWREGLTENCAYNFTGGTYVWCSVCYDRVNVTVTPPDNLVYDGTEKQFTVSVTRNDNPVDTKEYTVTCDNSKNAGSATVSVRFPGAAYTKEFTITPAELTVTGAAATSRDYNGTNAVEITGVTLEGICNSDDVSVDTANLTGTVNSADKGTYTTVTLPALTLTGAAKDNYRLNYSTGAAVPTDVTISPLKITITPDSGLHKEYGAADPVLTYTITSGELLDGDTITGQLARVEGETVGEYEITKGTLAAPSGNYTLTVTPSITFAITKPSLENADVTLSETEFTYDGTEKTPGVTVKKGNSIVDPGEYDISYSNTSGGDGNHTNAGTVTVTVSAKDPGNYSGSCSATFTIDQKTVTAAVTAVNKVYDGNTDAEVTASVSGSDLASGDSITITGVTGSFADANAGNGKTVNIDSSNAVIDGTGAGNYAVSFPKTTTADITKANAAITVPPSAGTLTYTGEAQALVTAGTASVGEVVYSLTETGTYSTTIPTGTNAGSYTVWYKIADTDNYNGTAPVKVDVTIAKVNYTGEKAGSTSGKFGITKTYNLANLLPEGYVLGRITITDTSSIFDGTPTVSGTVLTYKLVNDSQKVDCTGTITIPVTESTNYNSFDLTITVTVTNVRIPNLTVNPISVTYTGSPVSSDKITGTATVDGVEVTGTWSFVSGQNLTNVADSGVKSVVFNPTNTSVALQLM